MKLAIPAGARALRLFLPGADRREAARLLAVDGFGFAWPAEIPVDEAAPA